MSVLDSFPSSTPGRGPTSLRAEAAARRILSVLAAASLAALLVGCGSDDGLAGPVGADMDGDGVADGADNCVAAANPGQLDSDGDGIGNVCDNCPFAANPAQTDLNLDGVGDLCVGDLDGDGVGDFADNCPFTVNPLQEDRDLDGQGDACDVDLDGDGLGNDIDPDIDGDGVGNAADAFPRDGFRCRDVDGDTCDDCASGVDDPSADGVDSDGDGFCDAGLAEIRLTVGVQAAERVFGTQLAVAYDASRMQVADPGVEPLGPYDEDSYPGAAPGILVTPNTAVDGMVIVGATFTELAPDPSFATPAAVFELRFMVRGGGADMDDFDLMECELVDSSTAPVPGGTCMLMELDAAP